MSNEDDVWQPGIWDGTWSDETKRDEVFKSARRVGKTDTSAEIIEACIRAAEKFAADPTLPIHPNSYLARMLDGAELAYCAVEDCGGFTLADMAGGVTWTCFRHDPNRGEAMIEEKTETPVQWLERLGDDAAKWASEFRKTAIELGYSDMDEGWLIGWFANAIEHSSDVRRWRAEKASKPCDPDCEFLPGHIADHPCSRKVLSSTEPPTHRCKTCGASWWHGLIGDGGEMRPTWILCSDGCAPCCASTTGAEMEPLFSAAWAVVPPSVPPTASE